MSTKPRYQHTTSFNSEEETRFKNLKKGFKKVCLDGIMVNEKKGNARDNNILKIT